MSESARKPRNIVRFREREVARVTKAVREAGGGTVTLDPATGNYTIVVTSTFSCNRQPKPLILLDSFT